MARKHKPRNKLTRQEQRTDSPMRVVGGRFRGSHIDYDGDPATRPMKERIREAVFNLIGLAVRDRQAIDLFAGTGAMGIESLSRGARHCVLIERRFPAVRVIEANVARLRIQQQVDVVAGDAFLWVRQQQTSGDTPWLVFCCPPYEFFVSRRQDLLTLCDTLIRQAPVDSLFVVESDRRFDPQELPHGDQWDVRTYPPAVIAVFEKVS